jgi:O-antigen/teichoic acid export membrane protein
MNVDLAAESNQKCTLARAGKHLPFATNTAIVIASQIARYGFTLATWAVIEKIMGPKVLGEVQVAYLVPGFVLLLTNLGLPIANIYFLSKRAYSLPQILGNVLLRWLIESCAVVPLLLLARGLVLKYIPLNIDVYFVVVAWIPLQILNSYLTSVLTAQMRFYQQFLINLVQGTAVMIAVLIAVFGFGLNTAGVVGGLAAATVIVVLLELWLLRDDFAIRAMQPPGKLMRESCHFRVYGRVVYVSLFFSPASIWASGRKPIEI